MVTAESVVDEGAARRYVQERTHAICTLMAGLLAVGVHRGELDPDIDVHARAAEIVAFMEGIQIQWLLHPDQIDLAAAYESYVTALADQLATTEGTAKERAEGTKAAAYVRVSPSTRRGGRRGLERYAAGSHVTNGPQASGRRVEARRPSLPVWTMVARASRMTRALMRLVCSAQS